MHERDLPEIPPVAAAELLAQLDAEQDQLLAELDQLNDRIESLLRTCVPETVDPRVAAIARLRAAA